MSWRDRPYAGEEQDGGGGGGFAMALPRWTPVVRKLIIANVAVALATILCTYIEWMAPAALNVGSRNALYALGGLDFRLAVAHGQLWRFFTTQYLHADPMHLLFNMIGLYFLGPPLERRFGGRTFFAYYTVCGLAGGVSFVLAKLAFGQMSPYIIGASGAVLGLLAGCAVLFPRMVIILLFFPVPIRVAAMLFLGLYVMAVAWGRDLSDAAHLGGLATGWAWIMVGRRYEGRGISSWGIRRAEWRWKKRQADAARAQERVDRILDKIRERGIASLSWLEKRALRKATEQQRELDRQRDRETRRH